MFLWRTLVHKNQSDSNCSKNRHISVLFFIKMEPIIFENIFSVCAVIVSLNISQLQSAQLKWSSKKMFLNVTLLPNTHLLIESLSPTVPKTNPGIFSKRRCKQQFNCLGGETININTISMYPAKRNHLKKDSNFDTKKKIM